MTGEQHGLFPPEAPKRLFTLSPSEFGFLWQECKRCYYLKVTQKYARPGVFPKIFTAIDNQMRQRFEGQRTEKVAPDLPPGVFDCRDQWVASSPIAITGRNSLCIVRGKIDALVRFDDGAFAVVDFKTSSQSDRNVATYTRQLSAYAYALENAPVGQTSLRPIQRLGLLVFDPKQFLSEKGGAQLKGSLTWAEIPRDDNAFLKFLEEVVTVLDLPVAPPPTAGCAWCAYREAARQNLY